MPSAGQSFNAISALFRYTNAVAGRRQTSHRPPKPVLVFDGDCSFCRFWVERWRRPLGEEVEVIPFQDPSVAARFPEITVEEFSRAVHLVERNGLVSNGAEAVFRAAAYAPKKRWWLRLYETVPGWARITEAGYRFVAEHRPLFSALTRAAFGSDPSPPTYFATRTLFLALLGAVYWIAFLSLGTQMKGLFGQGGILPVAEFMETVRGRAAAEGMGLRRFWEVPTLCWLGTSDWFLQGLCGAGAALAVLVVLGVAPVPSLVLLWLLYLSLVVVGREFLSFQWDALLLETGFLAIFFAPWQWVPPRWRRGPRPAAPVCRPALWLLRLLLFKLMFCSGVVKLSSGDPHWRNLGALQFHYETQPLPTLLAWYAHQLPDWFHQLSCALMFGIELVVPFFIFAPARFRRWTFLPLASLQVLILLTGNYGFFNWLSLALCVLVLDDGVLNRVLSICRGATPPPPWSRARWPAWVVAPLTLVLVGATVIQIAQSFRQPVRWPAPLRTVYGWLQPLRSSNQYGLFAVMTTARPEILLEGSEDGRHWRTYEFKYKPGDPACRPRFVAPHQPRLDWQMWFAALGRWDGNPWFLRFCERLLQGAPPVTALLEGNPFPDRPPRYLRALLYEYRFTNYASRRAEGRWWRRELRGLYCPTLSLPEERPSVPVQTPPPAEGPRWASAAGVPLTIP